MGVATIETRDYLTCRQAAEELGLSPDTVRQYIHNASRNRTPQLKGFQVAPGTDLLIHRSELNRYKKERKDVGRPTKD